MIQKLVAFAAVAMLALGTPATAAADPVEEICSVEVLGWRAC